jgi:polysaccharide pyruvyl transferase WcaK-like protein
MQFSRPHLPLNAEKSAVEAPQRSDSVAVERGSKYSTKAKRIALLGNFGSFNLGNEASFEAMLRTLRNHHADADIVSICRYPERLQQRFGIPSYPLGRRKFATEWRNRLDRFLLYVPSTLRLFASALLTTRAADILIVPGTGLLDDFGERPSAMPLELCIWCLTALLLNRPVAFVSIGAGPIKNRSSRLLMSLSARMASYRSYRDEASKVFVAGLGVNVEDDDVYPDIVFSLDTPEISLSGGRAERLRVGIGVMSYYGWCPDAENDDETYGAYLANLAQFVIWTLQQGYCVRLLIGNQSDMPTVQAIIDRVAAQMDLDKTSLISEPTETFEQLMTQVLDTDVVVATRFHNVVAALKAGKPVISLGYADKNVHLLKEFELDRYNQKVDAIDVELLIRQFKEIVVGRERISASVRNKLGRLKKSLQRQEAHLLRDVI